MSSLCRKDSVGLGISGYERPGFYSHWGNILSLDFFSHRKPFDANIGIIANFIYLRKTRIRGKEGLRGSYHN